MTISTQAVSVVYVGNGATITFPLSSGGNAIYFDADEQIAVVLRDTFGVETPQILGTHYTVTGAGNYPIAGAVTFVTAPPTDWQVILYRDSEAIQLLDLTRGSAFDPESIEGSFDKLTLLIQEDRERLDRGFLIERGGTSFDAKGNRIINVGTPVDDSDAVTKSYVDDVADISADVEEAQQARDEAVAARDEAVAAVGTIDASQAAAEAAAAQAETAAFAATGAANTAIEYRNQAEGFAADAEAAKGGAEAAEAGAQAVSDNFADIMDGVPSASNHTIGTGVKNFTIPANLPFSVGAYVVITSTANPTVDWMNGQITSYVGTTLQVNVERTNGSGAHTDWVIQFSGPPGPQGEPGASGAGTGDVIGPAGSPANAVALFDGTTGKLLKSGGLLAPVATSGAYSDLTGTPTLGTMAAENAADYTKTVGFGDAAFKNTGVAAGQVAAGNHTHAGVYEPADATILKSASIGVTVQGYDADTLKSDVDKNLTAGYTTTNVNDGTPGAGATYTPTPVGGNMRRITNNAAFTFAAPTAANDYTMIVKVTNGAAAGAITFTGFTRAFGDALNTTNARVFVFVIIKIDAIITLQRIDTGLT
jgi:hypothetical protein